MTAEIAIMNKSGVALAADSMMSSGGRSWPGARKLFALSDHQPVAMMIYNNSGFMGDIWGDNIVPAFKERHGAKRYPTIADWTTAFAEFVGRYSRPDVNQMAANLHAFVDDLLSNIEYDAKAAVGPGGGLPGFSPGAALASTVDQYLNAEHGNGKVLTDDLLREIRTWGASVIKDASKREWISGDAGLGRKINRLIAVRLAGATTSGNHSGIVIAGYGAQQNAPALCALNVEGYLGPVLKMNLANSIDMAHERHAQIVPFAQRDMVDAFVTGMDASTRDFIESMLGIELVTALTELAAVEDIDRYGAACDDILRSVMEKVSQHCRRSYTDKVLSRVNIMSAHELPEFAQALVRISVMRHKYSIDQPSVGNPIDVALMSRSRQTVDLRLGKAEEDVWRMAS